MCCQVTGAHNGLEARFYVPLLLHIERRAFSTVCISVDKAAHPNDSDLPPCWWDEPTL